MTPVRWRLLGTAICLLGIVLTGCAHGFYDTPAETSVKMMALLGCFGLLLLPD